MNSTRLYTPEVLGLAVSLSAWPTLSGPDVVYGEARSRTCGSRIALSLRLAEDSGIAETGMQVHACAIGQAAAALFAAGAAGRGLAELVAVSDQLRSWLGGGGPVPAWPGLPVLAPARDFPARHGAILLPWMAAVMALSSLTEAR